MSALYKVSLNKHARLRNPCTTFGLKKMEFYTSYRTKHDAVKINATYLKLNHCPIYISELHYPPKYVQFLNVSCVLRSWKGVSWLVPSRSPSNSDVSPVQPSQSSSHSLNRYVHRDDHMMAFTNHNRLLPVDTGQRRLAEEKRKGQASYRELSTPPSKRLISVTSSTNWYFTSFVVHLFHLTEG